MRVLYDDKNLYVGIDCEQLNAPIVRRLARRDTQIPSDGVWIDIDSRRTGVGAFHFAVNAAGMLSDGIHFDDTAYSSDWDAVWEAKVADTDRGYAAEFRIPLSVLRFSALPVQDWGFQVRRFIDARQETDDWAFYPRSAATLVPLFGRLDGLRDLAPRHAIELRPVRARARRLPRRRRRHDAGRTAGGRAAPPGVDARAHVTNELTLDATLNPDFGQVEADTVVLNLSTFETTFPEKRPFFLEGIDVFATVRPLVYTRRIGRQPVTPALASMENLVARPDPTPLYGAAKLVGTIGARTTVGLISALTGPNDIEIERLGGVRTLRRLDPWTTFNVARLKRKLAANAERRRAGVGGQPLRDADAGRLHLRADAEPARPLHQRRLRHQHRRSLALGGGRLRGRRGRRSARRCATAPTRYQPDGKDIVPGRVAAPGGSLYVGKEGGAHWLWSVVAAPRRARRWSSTTSATWNGRTTTSRIWRCATGR